MTAGYCIFETDFGACGVAWSDAGVTRIRLPGGDRAAMEVRLRKATGGEAAEPPPAIAAVTGKLKRYFAGEEVDFADAPLDHAGVPSLNAALYTEMRRLRWGETTTYGELARRMGAPGGARAVGRAMGENPTPVVIPCHRVLAAGDRLGGFSAWGGDVTKERLLVLEKVRLPLLL
jgi:methylated-DNA-[protein]-cysteine S-methyltransferase